MIRETLDPLVTELAAAIESRSAANFRGAFDRMTTACNTCHAGTQHKFIRIQRPSSPPATNQNYGPQRK
jgi:hypothetical protein